MKLTEKKEDFETIDRILKEQRKKGKVMQQNLNQRSLPSIGNINVILSHSVCFSLFWPQNTPFENAQRWMGKNTFPILLLNDDNMIGEH